MNPNIPNSEFQQKTFAKLSGIGIVGRSVVQSSAIPNDESTSGPSMEDIKSVAEEIFRSSTPSMVRGEKGDKGDKGDQGDPGIPDAVPIRVTICTPGGAKEVILYSKK